MKLLRFTSFLRALRGVSSARVDRCYAITVPAPLQASAGASQTLADAEPRAPRMPPCALLRQAANQ